MARKKDSPQKAALRELMGNYLKENNVKVKDGTDVNSIMRDMMSIILEGALDQELDEELGYSKYDYRNKETDNSRNGYSQKTLHTSYGDMEIDIPRDRKGDFEPRVVKKYQNSITQDMEEKIISMYAKGMTTLPFNTVIGLRRSWENAALSRLRSSACCHNSRFDFRSSLRISSKAAHSCPISSLDKIGSEKSRSLF